MWNRTVHLYIICKDLVLRGKGSSYVVDIYQEQDRAQHRALSLSLSLSCNPVSILGIRMVTEIACVGGD